MKNLTLGFGASSLVIILPLLFFFSGQSRFDPGHSIGPSVQPDRIILNVTTDPATSQSVTWRTDYTVDSSYAEIAIATAAPRFWRNARRVLARTERMDASMVKQAQVIANYHSVTFTDLLPDTLYAYRVGQGDHWSEWFHFRTASKESKPFSFLYVGDAQNDIMSLWSRLIRTSYSKVPEASFFIHAGDLVNHAHSEAEWDEWFYAGGWIHAMVPSVPVPGNHEYRGYNEADWDAEIRRLTVQWQPQFTLPDNGPDSLQESAYYFDMQGARILALNSNERLEEQAVWADSVLSLNPQKWTIATFHHPVYSASDRRDNAELRERWKPVFDKHGVDLVLQGHDHTYARGHTGPFGSNLMEGMNRLDTITGTVYVVSVSGGKMYERKPDGWASYGQQRDRAAENTQLFQVVRIHGDTLTFEAYTAVGELYDAFDLIKKGKGQPNGFVERKGEAIGERRHDNTIPYRDPAPAGAGN